jgi:conjugal transfer pilus assembly protein TraW
MDVIGPTYSIEEISLLDVIFKTLKEKEANGEIEKLQKEMTERSVNNIKNPIGRNMPVAITDSYRKFDPSIVLHRDIKLPDGQVMYPRGTIVNPLTIKPFTKKLIFIDGTDEKQVDFAIKQHEKSGYRDKIILVKGSYYELMKKHNIRFYFDQRVRNSAPRERVTLVEQFGIERLPSIVFQDDPKELYLTILEVAHDKL